MSQKHVALMTTHMLHRVSNIITHTGAELAVSVWVKKLNEHERDDVSVINVLFMTDSLPASVSCSA